MAFEQALADSSSKVVAIDGRVVGTDTSRHGLTNEVCHISWQGDPQQKQPILLMAFDAEDGRPVLSLMCEGEEIECANVADLLSQARFEGDTFVLARGIYDTELATPLTECGNHYVVALPEGTLAHKEVLCREMEGRFVWERGDEVTVVEYREDEVGGRRVIAYRDLSESTALQAAWLRTMGWRDDAIVQEFCDELAPLMGASVLETNLDVREWDAEAVYALYQRCAGVETCLDYVQDGRDARSLCELDYYRAQGHAFISLVAGLIHREVADALAASGLEMSLSDVLTCAHMVKAAKRGSAWVVVNCTKESIEAFDALNTGLEVV